MGRLPQAGEQEHRHRQQAADGQHQTAGPHDRRAAIEPQRPFAHQPIRAPRREAIESRFEQGVADRRPGGHHTGERVGQPHQHR